MVMVIGIGVDIFQRVGDVLIRLTEWMGFGAMNKESSTIVKVDQRDFSEALRC